MKATHNGLGPYLYKKNDPGYIDELIDNLVNAAKAVAVSRMHDYGVVMADRKLEEARQALKEAIQK